MVADTYLTIENPSEGEYKEKGSKFLAYAYPMEQENELDVYMTMLKDIHPKARHYCFAYKLGLDDNRFRTNDDGEPSGTAGKPIYGQIQSFGLTNVCIIVIRYFGGTKLGAAGLIHAYRESAKNALENAHIVQKYLYVRYHLIFGYEQMGHILNVLKELDIEIEDKTFEEDCKVTIQVRLSMKQSIMHQFKAKLLHKSLEEVDAATAVEFCKVEKL